MQNLSQRDKKWTDIKLGFSNSTTIGSHGCTITCVSMLAGLTPKEVNDRLKNVNGYAQTNLIIWSKIKEAIPWLEHEWRGYTYENEKVKSAIEKYGGCLVEVSGARIGGSKHWVLFIGDQKMIDPWTGSIKSTSWYGTPTGYSIIKVSEKENNQSNELAECLRIHGELVKELEQEKQKNVSLIEENKKLSEAIRDVRNQLSGCETRYKEKSGAYQSFVDKVAAKCGSIADEDRIIEKLEMNETTYSDTLKKATQLEKAMELLRSEKQEEIKQLKEEIIAKQRQYDNLLKRVEALEEEKEKTNRLTQWIKNLLESIFKGNDGKN